MESNRQLITLDQVATVLDATIKYDKTNKLVTFLCMLSAYTEDAQFNVSFNAPSSTGKTYIATEIAKLFPPEDVIQTGHSSPTAFLYQQAEKRDEEYHIDLERKIMIFLDQRDSQTLARLRPLLSHDSKEIRFSMTDNTQKLGRRTRNVIVHGHTSFVNCSAGQKIDPQEASRFLLLSPEMSQEKLHSGISTTISKESDPEDFRQRLADDPARQELINRIREIKDIRNESITIPNDNELRRRFFGANEVLQPRHQRDIKWLIGLIKAHALWNCRFRGTDPKHISANDEDLEVAWLLFAEMSASQNLSITPYMYQVFKKVIEPLLEETAPTSAEVGHLGITRQQIASRHQKVEGGNLDIRQLREEILPALEQANLIRQERSTDDRRIMLVMPSVDNGLPTRNDPTDPGTDLDTEISGIVSRIN